MIRAIPKLVRFAIIADRPIDVAFKVTALLVLMPVIVVVCVADVIEGVWRATR